MRCILNILKKYNFQSFFLKIFTYRHLFFIAYALNSLTISFLIVCCGFLGKFQISSYLAIAQSFSIVFFAIFSMNLRTLILTKKESEVQKYIFLRFLFFPFFIGVAYFFSVTQNDWFFVFLIILKRGFDWIEEPRLCFAEKNKDYRYLQFNLLINILGLLFSIVFLYTNQDYLVRFICLWIFSSILLNFKINKIYINKIVEHFNKCSIRNYAFFQKKYFEHYLNIISQIMLALVTFLLRFLIINVNGNDKAGIYFSAFAVISFFPTFLASINGPSFFFHNKKNRVNNFIFTHIIFLIIPVLITIYILIYLSAVSNLSYEKILFLHTILISFFAGYFLYVSQMQRLYLISYHNALKTYLIDIWISISCFFIFGLCALLKLSVLLSPFLFLITSFISFLGYSFFGKGLSFKYLKVLRKDF